MATRDEKEQAFRYDLFITPDWRDRFDTLINESIKLPVEGRFLDVNCGTGAHAIELAERMRGKGDVIGVDPGSERIAIARAKAQVKKLDNVTFQQAIGSDLPFEIDNFSIVIGDASLLRTNEVQDLFEELTRVAQAEGRVILKLITRGSFDEFFSIYWEALNDIGMADEVWTALEQLINDRRTVSDVEQMAAGLGLQKIETFVTKELFGYETAEEFLESPLIEDSFLEEWFEFLPEAGLTEVRERIKVIIDRERHGAPFEVSVKATIVTGIK